MEPDSKKRNRCMSFTAEEKILIANICARYKHILENKKTDHVSSDEKNKIWFKIATEVNSAMLSSSYRTPDVLKRFYENRKREVRKIAAEEKKEILTTGGGQAIKFKKEACHDIILSIMNSKTVYGLTNDYDGDTEPAPIGDLTDSNATKSNPKISNEIEDEVEIIYELSDSTEKEQGVKTWKKYIPTDLKKPVTTSLRKCDENQLEPAALTTKGNYNNEGTLMSVNSDTIGIEANTPQPKRRRTLPNTRRRPTTIIKALSRSELSEKYDMLLDKRLELTALQKKKIEEELLTIKGEKELKFELLKLQIEVEKEKLKNLQ